jgi:hypothetical protein
MIFLEIMWAFLIAIFSVFVIPIGLYAVFAIIIGLLEYKNWITKKTSDKLVKSTFTIWCFLGGWWVYLFEIRGSFSIHDSFPFNDFSF